jgi:2-keto-4-pentenoate hydratase/2-oxohepta-3-ene-1,7-dioic acid hydratase in catechol pathway
MKLAQFKIGASAQPRLGLLAGRSLIDVAVLARAVKHRGKDVSPWLLAGGIGVLDIIRHGSEALDELGFLIKGAGQGPILTGEQLVFNPDAVEFLPPVYPGKILAIGRNYVDHAIEGGEAPPPAPLVFTKLNNSLSAHRAPIVLHAISSQIDYEAELAVVIGRQCRRVSESEALDYVFGYTLINDVSARDLQFSDGQWVRGKSLDGFAPLGPFITTRDDIADVHALKIEGRLNGETMQSSDTGKMIFKVPYLIAYISQGITVEPGDVIATGTPEGVGIFRQPPVLLKAGDVFEVTVENLGTLSNTAVAPEE